MKDKIKEFGVAAMLYESQATTKNDKQFKNMEECKTEFRKLVGSNARVVSEVGETYAMSGSISAIGRRIEFNNPKELAKLLEKTGAVEIGCFLDGNAYMDIAINGLYTIGGSNE